jgi:hypothetical protein
VLFEETQLPPALRAELDELEDGLVELTAGALAGDPRSAPADPRLAARVVVNTIEGLTHRLVLRPPPGVTPRDVGREITTVVRAYLRSSI